MSRRLIISPPWMIVKAIIFCVCGRLTDKQASMQADKQTEGVRLTYRQTEKDRGRETDRQRQRDNPEKQQ